MRLPTARPQLLQREVAAATERVPAAVASRRLTAVHQDVNVAVPRESSAQHHSHNVHKRARQPAAANLPQVFCCATVCDHLHQADCFAASAEPVPEFWPISEHRPLKVP